ncbi:hypothetical protein GGR51DRAFT_470431 [Nemania sp. FL0031]|nr:hypothetical protein GGR51DRAFT_470431 [Nemania sp. FL0031]
MFLFYSPSCSSQVSYLAKPTSHDLSIYRRGFLASERRSAAKQALALKCLLVLPIRYLCAPRPFVKSLCSPHRPVIPRFSYTCVALFSSRYPFIPAYSVVIVTSSPNTIYPTTSHHTILLAYLLILSNLYLIIWSLTRLFLILVLHCTVHLPTQRSLSSLLVWPLPGSFVYSPTIIPTTTVRLPLVFRG